MRCVDISRASSRNILFALICFSLATTGCSPGARQAVARSVAAGAAGASAGGNTYSTQKLMVFGGQDHRTYLGCLNCSEYATDSVFNRYGTYGSSYSASSIWNHYNEFGSAYSSFGACNKYASDPPVIVDSSGNYYGRLTLNQYHAQIGAGRSYYDWLENTVCKD